MSAFKHIGHSLVALLTFFFTAGCTNIECPLENVVMLHCGIYSSEEGKELKLRDTLTVRAMGTDSILWNRGYGISEFSVPLSITATADTLLLRLSNNKGQWAVDTLVLGHTNTPHFESVDCPVSMFHRLTSVRWTSHHLSEMPLTVDSVAISRSLVDYATSHNVKIFLRSTSR